MIKPTEWNIQQAIGKHLGLQNIVIPNVKLDYGMYEADLIYIVDLKYVYEVEIKIDFQDFKRDFRKHKYHDDEIIRGLLCIPESVIRQKERRNQRTASGKESRCRNYYSWRLC